MRKVYLRQPQSQTVKPLDDLPACRAADALDLLRAIRQGYAPHVYIAGSKSANVLADLKSAGLIHTREVTGLRRPAVEVMP